MKIQGSNVQYNTKTNSLHSTGKAAQAPLTKVGVKVTADPTSPLMYAKGVTRKMTAKVTEKTPNADLSSRVSAAAAKWLP